MPTPRFSITCTKNVIIAKDVFEFRFSKPEGFTFVPGQFILFDVPAAENPADVQTRAMSIASSTHEDELIFVAKMKEGGRASRWIKEKLQPGVAAVMQGPFGVFKLDRQTEKEYLLIATSTGVAPFRSQLFSFLPEGDQRRIDLIVGVRTEEDVFWQDELEHLSQEYTNFFLHFALSQPTEQWKGHRGRVQTLVPLICPHFSNKKVYVCGSPDMTKEMKRLSLESWGIQKEDFHMEGYI